MCVCRGLGGVVAAVNEVSAGEGACGKEHREAGPSAHKHPCACVRMQPLTSRSVLNSGFMFWHSCDHSAQAACSTRQKPDQERGKVRASQGTRMQQNSLKPEAATRSTPSIGLPQAVKVRNPLSCTAATMYQSHIRKGMACLAPPTYYSCPYAPSLPLPFPRDCTSSHLGVHACQLGHQLPGDEALDGVPVSITRTTHDALLTIS